MAGPLLRKCNSRRNNLVRFRLSGTIRTRARRPDCSMRWRPQSFASSRGSGHRHDDRFMSVAEDLKSPAGLCSPCLCDRRGLRRRLCGPGADNRIPPGPQRTADQKASGRASFCLVRAKLDFRASLAAGRHPRRSAPRFLPPAFPPVRSASVNNGYGPGRLCGSHAVAPASYPALLKLGLV